MYAAILCQLYTQYVYDEGYGEKPLFPAKGPFIFPLLQIHTKLTGVQRTFHAALSNYTIPEIPDDASPGSNCKGGDTKGTNATLFRPYQMIAKSLLVPCFWDYIRASKTSDRRIECSEDPMLSLIHI